MARPQRLIGESCALCGCTISFNRSTHKWVTSKNDWKCKWTPEYPVRAHAPAPETETVVAE